MTAAATTGEADARLIALLGELGHLVYGFVTPTPATIARIHARNPGAMARDLRDVFGWSRPFRRDLLPPGLFALMEQAGLLALEGSAWRSLVRVSTLDGALYLHSAYPTNAADSVFFGPDTYRFARAIRHGIERRSGPIRRAVDIGAGAGPGGLTVARAAPDAEIVLADINPTALRFAAGNAAAMGAANVATAISNVLAGVAGAFDLIVSNPPYLNDPLQRGYRHGGGPLGAGLSTRIAVESLGRLAPGGTLILYTGVAIVNGDDPFLSSVEGVLRAAPVTWSYEEVDPDVFGEELEEGAYLGADRIAASVLTATREE